MELKNIISVIIFVAGVIVILNIINIYLFYTIRLKRWKNIEGEIIESGVEYFRSKTDSDTEGWRQKIIYIYNIDGIEYKNYKITKNIEILLPSESSAIKNSKSYFVGQKITVYVNNKNPKESIIDSSFDNSNLLYVLIGIVAIFVSNYIKSE
jgi:hypothetical protein